MRAELIDIPFEYRYTCWYCGEPSDDTVIYGAEDFDASDSILRQLEIPACDECRHTLKAFTGKTVDDSLRFLKDALLHHYSKHLAIGSRWTEQELIESDFTGLALEGFGRSGWGMFEIAKARIAFPGWPLSVDEIAIDFRQHSNVPFEHDGIQFTNLKAAIRYYSKTFNISADYLLSAVEIVGQENLTRAIRFCRLNPASNDDEQELFLDDLYEAVQEERA